MKYVVFALFVATVYAANWALQTFGVVPIGFGLMAPAGVFFAGLGFLLRDVLHEIAGRAWVVTAIGCGALLSWWLGADATIPGGHVPIAVASGLAFLTSEFADYSVYAPLRDRTIAGAVAASQVVGAAVDSALFLYLAFGALAFFAGQFTAKAYMTVPALLALGAWRARTAYA